MSIDVATEAKVQEQVSSVERSEASPSRRFVDKLSNAAQLQLAKTFSKIDTMQSVFFEHKLPKTLLDINKIHDFLTTHPSFTRYATLVAIGVIGVLATGGLPHVDVGALPHVSMQEVGTLVSDPILGGAQLAAHAQHMDVPGSQFFITGFDSVMGKVFDAVKPHAMPSKTGQSPIREKTRTNPREIFNNLAKKGAGLKVRLTHRTRDEAAHRISSMVPKGKNG